MDLGWEFCPFAGAIFSERGVFCSGGGVWRVAVGGKNATRRGFSPARDGLNSVNGENIPDDEGLNPADGVFSPALGSFTPGDEGFCPDDGGLSSAEIETYRS